MNKLALLVFLVGMSITATAQTRRIAHRAHSGSMTEKSGGLDGNYGNTPMFQTRVVAQQKLVRLASGKDTVVWDYDTITEPAMTQYYAQLSIFNANHVAINSIDEMGKVCKRISQKNR